MKTQKEIKNQIMRRVYYTFALRLATHTTTLHLLVLVAATYALGYFVHVAAVFKNVAAVPVGELGGYLAGAAMHTEGITLVVLGAVILALLSLPLSLPHRHRMQTM